MLRVPDTKISQEHGALSLKLPLNSTGDVIWIDINNIRVHDPKLYEASQKDIFQMTEAEHIELVQQESAGNLLISIDRIFARRFYTYTSINLIESATGEALYLEKFIVFACFLGSPIFLIVSIVLSFVFFRWWVLLISPICFGYWFLIYNTSPKGTSRMLVVSVFLILSIVAYLTKLIPDNTSILFFSIALSSFLCRLLYVASTFLLRLFVLRNYRAYNLVQEGITLKYY